MLCVFSDKLHRLIEQRIQFFSAIETARATFAFTVGGDAINILWATTRFPVLHHGMNFLIANKSTMNTYRQRGVRPRVKHIPIPSSDSAPA